MIDTNNLHRARTMVKELAAAGAFNNTRSPLTFKIWSQQHANDFSFSFSVSTGCFKIVIVPKNFDYVIKTAITFTYAKDTDTTIEEQHKDLNGPYAELEQWHNICGTAFEEYFLETIYLMTIGNHEFFLQPKAVCDEYAITNSLKSYIDADEFECEEDLDEYVEYDYSVEELLNSLWGDEVGSDLYAFLNEMDISDIHKGNIGFYNGQPVIIDYAS